MEDNRDYKKVQKFYFTEEGQLVVESNKGVWVDGEQFVKMYGNFVCNAKTMGIIIQHFKGIPVEVGIEENIRLTTDTVVDDLLNINDHTINHYCIIGADKERIKGYEEELAINHFTNKEIEKAKALADMFKDSDKKRFQQLIDIEKSISEYNALPWYKRIFKKITVYNH